MARYLVLVRWYGKEGDWFDVVEFDDIRDAMDFVRKVFDKEKGQAILIDRSSLPQVIELLRRWY